MKINQIYHMDCLEGMEKIANNSIDFIFCDLPYGLTGAEWDCIIPFDLLWKQYKRIAKKNTTVALFAVQPFTTSVICSNLKEYQTIWYWKKNQGTGHLTAKKMPMKFIEEIVIFCINKPSEDNRGKYKNLREYFLKEREKSQLKTKDIKKMLGNHMASHYFTRGKQFQIPTRRDYEILQKTGCFTRTYESIYQEFRKESSSTDIVQTYHPQGVYELTKPKTRIKKGNQNIYRNVTEKEHTQRFSGYPKNILEFNTVKNINRYHPTQKPIDLLEYIIKTYTNENDIVLDNCAGSGSILVAAQNTRRNYIGFEKDKQFFDVACKRLKEAQIMFKTTK